MIYQGAGVDQGVPVLWMYFLKFSNMTEADKEEFQFACDYMYRHKSMHTTIYCNGACIKKSKTTKKIVGTMYAAGWRGAQVPCIW